MKFDMGRSATAAAAAAATETAAAAAAEEADKDTQIPNLISEEPAMVIRS